MTPAGTIADAGSAYKTPNYAITFATSANGTISTRAITVTAAANSKGYDGNTSAAATPTVTLGTLATGDLGTFSETYDNKNVAGSPNKVMTPAGTIADAASANMTANYAITFATSANGTISTRAITVTAAANSKGYDGNTSAARTPTVTLGTLATGDLGTFSETYDNKNVAGSPNKVMTPAGTIADAASANMTANYAIPFATSDNGTLSTRAITVTAAANSKGYDGNTSAAATPTVTLGTLATGDVGTFSETYDNKNVAGSPNKVMTPAGTIADAGSANMTANYAITFATSANGTISTRPITVTAAANSKGYDGNTSEVGTPRVCTHVMRSSGIAS